MEVRSAETRDIDILVNMRGRLQQHLVCGLDEAGSVAGMGLASVFHNADLEQSRLGKIDDIWVDVASRRQGLGSLIVSELLRFFRQKGIQTLTLNYVVSNDEAEAFWASLAFRPIIVMAKADRSEAAAALKCGGPPVP